MAHRRTLTLLAVIALLWGCGPPVLDPSSPERLLKSAKKLEESLEPEQVPLLEDAFVYLSDGTELGDDPARLGHAVEAYAPLAGKTAEQIILEAWTTRVNRLESRISELVARREASETARQLLSGLEIVEAKLFPAAAGFLQAPVADVEVSNRTRYRLFSASFQVSLRHPDDIEPWVVEVVERPIGAGLKPGKRATFRLEPQDGDWEKFTAAAADDVFVCDLMRLEGRRGKVIADSSFGSLQEFQLRAYEERLAELRAARPPFE